jgi:hypothetical protein
MDVTGIVRGATRNALLSALSHDDFALLQPSLTRVACRSGNVLAAAGGSIDRVCFPEGGVTAFLAVAAAVTAPPRGWSAMKAWSGSGPCWARPIGRTRWFSAPRTAMWWRSKPAGCSTHAAIAEPDRAAATLRRHFDAAIRAHGTSNLVSQLERRMARWILLYHDRLQGDEFPMTHEEIGIMLGVRRASATDILHILEGERAIHNARGRLVIRDRARLEEIAGDTYGEVEATYRTLIGPFGKGNAASPKPVAARLE